MTADLAGARTGDLPYAAGGDRAAQPRCTNLVRPGQERVRHVVGRRPSRSSLSALVMRRPVGAQQELITAEPGKFFTPPYVGGRGWIGVRLDRSLDWAEIAELCQDAYRAIAPPAWQPVDG